MPVELYTDARDRDIYIVPDIVRTTSNETYEIQERIASGGNAVVHGCAHTASGNEYAIKLQLARGFKRFRRFKREIKLLKSVSHAQLIQFVDEGVAKGQKRRSHDGHDEVRIPFLVMPRADDNLKTFLHSHNREVPYEQYVAQFKGLASALAALHQKAVHRDIKPENVLIRGESWILSDLGLCAFSGVHEDAITVQGEPVGPRYWMSPEAINSAIGNPDEISKQSDVFQLCSVFWYVVTGRYPAGVVRREDWNGPENIFAAIYRALSHNPELRPADGVELEQLLAEATM